MADENMQPVAYMHREGRIIRADVLLRSLDRAAGDSGPRARHDVGFTIELFTADQVAAKIRDGFDPRHPVAQNLIGRNARLSIALDIVRDILADDCEPTPITAEHWAPIHDQAQSVVRERNELRQEVERLRADAARLDFIEKRARYDPKLDGNHAWWPTTFEHVLRGPTLRAAIDAQMHGEQK